MKRSKISWVRPGFTLVELMAVITIMVILAAMVIGGTGYVQQRQAREKARVQIHLLSNALEKYKLDNGVYPVTSDGDGSGNSQLVFNALYYEGANDSTREKTIYVGELDPANTKQGWTKAPASASTKIMDPWGYEYRYRTATDASGGSNASTINPDFDLWSVGKDGKSSPATPSSKENMDDIK